MEPLQGKTGIVCYIEIPVYGQGILVTRMGDRRLRSTDIWGSHCMSVVQLPRVDVKKRLQYR
jgi:hypothetical protein